ncbi:MAG: ATP-binding cassette domain-containing protein [Acholeplasmataceae bacterium]|jgi:spermidine/putrescine transport system ATP-binding protein|nr:ATP-binding cassette domain-containing protein [Acholeplasmataceae bacterium]
MNKEIVNKDDTTLIELVDVTKAFGEQVVLKGLNLKINSNEFVTLLGPSGCGKTTTLRIIGGFVEPSSGQVLFNGKDINEMPAHKRPSNTVFQRYSLFPHLDVFENVAFGLRVKSREFQAQYKIERLVEEYDKLIENEKDSTKKKELKKEVEEKIQLIKDPNFELKQKINELKQKSEDLKNGIVDASLLKEENALKISKLQNEIDRIKLELKTALDKSNDYNKIKKEKQKEIKKLQAEIKNLDLKRYYQAEIKKYRRQFETPKMREEALKKKVFQYLNLVGLQGYEYRSVDKLSGGQQQRVAIARALINEPKVLLLDEPLAALDLKLRQEMQYELKELQRNAGITFIFITHEQEEALTMSDKVVVMNEGEIQQIGTPEDIYNEPINRFVASFIGESNIVEAVMLDDYKVLFDDVIHECVDKGFSKNEQVEVVIRPEDIDILPKGKGKFDGIVDSIIFKGVHYEIGVTTKYRTYIIHTTDHHLEGEKVSITFQPDDIHVMEIWE